MGTFRSALHQLIAGLGLGVALAAPAFAATITLTGTVRDFCDGPPFTSTTLPAGCTAHPDFETKGGFDPGIVDSALGVDKKPVYAGTAGNPTTTSMVAFDQWYRDTAGINKSMSHSITLSDAVTPGLFTYSDSAFFPADGLLWGNQGRSHNYGFTFELNTVFTYVSGSTFTFVGDDDVWVFINDKLAIDLGGVHGAMSASVSLDTIAASYGLTPGGTYDLDLFFAERHTVASSFRIDTTLSLLPPPPPPSVPAPGTLALLGIGLLGVGALRRRAAGCWTAQG